MRTEIGFFDYLERIEQLAARQRSGKDAGSGAITGGAYTLLMKAYLRRISRRSKNSAGR
ncbi:MAG: hypothetical protein ACJAYS_000718 [Lentimonas sp.]|jgi:hypothetical protein